MAFVDIPKDLTKVKPKVLFGLTRKQLRGFSAAVLFGGVTFFTTKISVGNTLAIILLMIVAMPFVLYAIYEPTGLTVEQYVSAMFQFIFVSHGIRPYETENIYKIILEKSEKERSGSIETNSYKKPKSKTQRRKRQDNSETGSGTKTAKK